MPVTLLTILLLCSLPASALDIIEVVTRAEQHDASFQAARAGYLADLEAQNITDAGLYPQLALNAFARRTSSSTTNSTSSSSPNGDSRFGAHGYSLVLSQTLYDASLSRAARAEAARAARAQTELEAARQALYLRVAERYFDLVSAQQAVELAAAEQRAIALQLEQNQQRFDAGLIPNTDVTESQARYDLAVADKILAEITLNDRREALRLLINQPVEPLDGLAESMPLSLPQPADVDSWLQLAEQNNPQLLASSFALRAASEDYDSARAELYPTLSLDAEHSFSSSDGSSISNAFSGRDIDENRLTLNLDLPLYTGGGTRAGIRQKLAERDRARAEYEQQRRLTSQQVRNAYLNIKATISRVKALKQALASTRLAVEATQAGFDVGRRTSVDVLLAQREQFVSQFDYSRARYDYVINLLKLKQASGTLAVDDLVALNQFVTRQPAASD